MLLLAQLWGENSTTQRVHWWFTLPLSSSAISSVGCGAQQGALWVPCVWIYSCPRHSGITEALVALLVWESVLAPKPQPNSSSYFLMPLPILPGCITDYFLTSDGELPEAATSWHRLMLPPGKMWWRGALWKEKLWKLVLQSCCCL